MRLEYFQMVDRIITLDVRAGRIATACQVPEQSPVFEGHFPGYPILPGVLMIETMAQTGGWLLLATLRCSRMPFLMQVEKAKMRSFVAPGQALQVEATLLHEGSGYAVVKASIAAEGKKVTDAEIRYGVVPFPNETLRSAMLATACRIGLPEAFRPAALQAGVLRRGDPPADQPRGDQPQADQPQDDQRRADPGRTGGADRGGPHAGEPRADEPRAREPQVGELRVGEPQVGAPRSGEPRADEPAGGRQSGGRARDGHTAGEHNRDA